MSLDKAQASCWCNDTAELGNGWESTGFLFAWSETITVSFHVSVIFYNRRWNYTSCQSQKSSLAQLTTTKHK
ncbi:hypothetical protein BS50DRAFT_359309 [Corynespora cassiicola Philippines]|uniref:Uncharacterized protein n=1 Tax=Corynespora cassiicola Philippines TaxID=1448308 RepID=A0A2T2NT17_CORCC|nr:hypothetical protein BS50DRAFT_359309 [Corynespora cassiicola Philippines]